MDTKAIIEKAINQFIKTISKEKLAFMIVNGGWEKMFENELSFNIWCQIHFTGGWVTMQDKRVDVKIFDSPNHLDSIIEIGHYTLNQPFMGEFKPYFDIKKRADKFRKIYHIQLIEFIENIDSSYKSKYGEKQKNEIDDYLKTYSKYSLPSKIINFDTFEALGYKITFFVILSESGIK